MTNNDFEVNPEQIRSHAKTVGEAADKLSSAAQGMPGELPGDALGPFVQFLTTGLSGAMTQTTDAVAHASSTMDGMSSALVRTAEDYQRADDDNAALLLRKDSP